MHIENKLMATKGEHGVGGEDKLGVWDQQIQTTICIIDKQQGSPVYSISCSKL